MILRALAVLVGIPLLLFGLLATVVAVRMVGDPGPHGGPPPIAIQVIGTGIMASLALTGAALTWLGLRKRSKSEASDTSPSVGDPRTAEVATPVPRQETTGGVTSVASEQPAGAAEPTSAGPATIQQPTGQQESFGDDDDPGSCDEPAEEDFDSIALEDDGHEEFRIGTTGQLIGKCGPKMSGQLHYYFVGAVVVAVGFAVMIGLQVAPGKADPATAAKVGLWLGSGLVLFGGLIIVLQLMRAPQTISLYDDRLEEELGPKLRTIPLDRVIRVQLQEFYEHRFASQTSQVTVHINGDRHLKFSTALGGDADLIVRCLADIVADVEVLEFAG